MPTLARPAGAALPAASASTAVDLAIEAHGLGKRYGDHWALRDLELQVPAGSVLALLGHNGAGKTTTVRILATLAQPSTGSATVAGYDIATAAHAVRASIGLASQAATVDGLLTARHNLELVGRLHRLSKRDAKARADELLQRLGLADVGDNLVKTYSGGMRRRLDLAATLVGAPPVLFLDEPTTGLDPRSRNDLWELLRELVRSGTTLVLTTQYLEEADRLADHIVLLDHGREVAAGAPAALKTRIGGDRVEVSVAAPSDLQPAADALVQFADGAPVFGELTMTVPVVAGTSFLAIARTLDAAGVAATDVARRETTLDDVFLALTEA